SEQSPSSDSRGEKATSQSAKTNFQPHKSQLQPLLGDPLETLHETIKLYEKLLRFNHLNSRYSFKVFQIICQHGIPLFECNCSHEQVPGLDRSPLCLELREESSRLFSCSLSHGQDLECREDSFDRCKVPPDIF